MPRHSYHQRNNSPHFSRSPKSPKTYPVRGLSGHSTYKKWGGFFERLVGSAKRCLKKILGNSRLTYEELLTAVLEVEAVLNSRPLTYVSTEELQEPLTPSHLIFGRRLLSLPSPASQDIDQDWSVTKQDVTRRMNHLNNLLDQFWKRWKDEKLRRISLGDMVLIHEDGRRRCHWRMGKVNDGEVRGAKVTVSSKGLRPTTVRQPVQKLHPLEVNCSNSNDGTANQEAEARDDCSAMENEPNHKRPKRAAAIEAEVRRKQWIAEGSIDWLLV